MCTLGRVPHAGLAPQRDVEARCGVTACLKETHQSFTGKPDMHSGSYTGKRKVAA